MVQWKKFHNFEPIGQVWVGQEEILKSPTSVLQQSLGGGGGGSSGHKKAFKIQKLYLVISHVKIHVVQS